MTLELIRRVEQSQLKKGLPKLSVGDTVDVQVRIIEGAKERVQTFNGVIIRLQGTGITQSITVRRIVANEGVERMFRIHSPKVIGIEVKRHGHVRRAKLYYLRERVGKQRRLRDRRRGLEGVLPAEQPEPSLAPESATQSIPETAAVQPPPAQA